MVKLTCDAFAALDAQRMGRLFVHLAGCDPVRTTGLMARPDGASVSVQIAGEEVVVDLKREDALLIEDDLEARRRWA